MNCPICQHQTDHLICTNCSNHITDHLHQIEYLIQQGHLQLLPKTTPTPTPPAYTSKPPINLDAIDPELAPLQLNPGDQSSTVTILEMLEMWERTIRELRNLTPYGQASAERTERTGHSPADTQYSLRACIGFLQTHHQWICQDPHFPHTEYADHLKRAHTTLKRWDPNRQPAATRIPCPTTTEHGDCNYPIQIHPGEPETHCKRCGRTWKTQRLITVAGRDADVWVDAEAAATIAGIHQRTIRRWAATGKVARRGYLYRIQDVKTTAEKQGA